MRLSIHRFGFALGCTLLAFAFSFNPAAAQAEPVRVGIVHRVDFAYAKMMKHAFEMALKQINAAGGINGSPLEVRYADDRGEPNAGVEAVKTLIRQDKALMLVGAYSSSNALQMAFSADRLDTPFLVCTAADDHITQHDLRNVFRLNPPAREYAKALEAFLLARVKPKSMSIVYENSPYGTGGARRMMAFCRANDIALTGIHPYFKDAANLDYLARVLAPVRANQPDVVYMVSYLEDATLLVRKAREMKLKSLLCGGAGGFTHENFIRRSGAAAENLITATLWSSSSKNPMAQQFRDRFVAQFAMEPDYHAAEAFSSLLVAAEALKRSPSMTSADIRAALAETDLMTPFGRVTFENYGYFKRQNDAETQVFQIKDGRFETIWPPDLATATFIPPLK
jgi:branched-chain amino acid transport system substrate-binding protein